ncbi:MAG: molybdopterin molybdotransferase MoeA [Magnetococcales bacterium]|nr:molybdopterin molybdotransferase MoeA [Magnetococcales bacterium]
MIPYEEARVRVLEQVRPLSETEETPVRDALGMVLSKDISAPFHVPNHDNSAMDGYATLGADLSTDAPVTLTVIADLPAGDRLTQTIQPGEAVRIMTGAPIPPGCDTVVMQEVTQRDGDQVTIAPGARPGGHVRPAGEDLRAGETVLTRGTRLQPADLGLLTSLGFAKVPTYRKIRVGVLSTGNEVVEAGTPLKPGQVYDSNRTTLLAALTALGVEVVDLGLVGDNLEATEAALKRGMEKSDALLSTGGVSVGDYDLVKVALAKLGKIHFWKVAMKPGKPQAYGQLGNCAFFGLPGNPVSGMVTYLTMVRPALFKMMGTEPQSLRQVTAVYRGPDVKKKPGRLHFVRAQLHFEPDGLWVTSTGPQGSGILSSMSKANALMVLPEQIRTIQEGDKVETLLIDYA